MGLLSREQLLEMGFAAVGENVRVSDRASFHGCDRITLGSHVRIDDFCVVSAGVGGISIGNFVHLAVQGSLLGAGSIRLADFCNLSSRVSIFSSSDDYSGRFMTNPMVPSQYTNVHVAPVTLEKHVIVGSGSVVLPGATLHEGVAVGALSLVKGDCEAFGIYAGTPAKRMGERDRNLLDLERQIRAEFRSVWETR